MASKRRKRQRSCLNKQTFDVYERAFAHAHNLRKQFGQPYEAYKCEFGDHFHVGRGSRKKSNARSAQKRKEQEDK